MRDRLIPGLLLACGVGLAAAGGASLYRGVTVDAAVDRAYRLVDQNEAADGARLQAALDALDGRAGADPAAARMQLRYRLAWKMPDRLEWRRQLLLGLGDGRQALAVSPTRADVALLLADIEFVLFGPGEWVYQPLALSFQAAPLEGWLVARRIGLDLRLVAAAPPPAVKVGIASDIRLLGEPFRSTDNYRILAEAAFVGGAPAIAAVREELARGHPWPLQVFNAEVGKLGSSPASNAPATGR